MDDKPRSPRSDQEKNSPRDHIHKKEYTVPNLISYGQVKTLTQGGLSGSNEAAGMETSFMSSSDIITKENIVRIGTHPLGIGIYLFDYKSSHKKRWGYGRQFGVMAQEVKTVMPKAVSIDPDGYMVVDYAMLGITRNIH